MADYELSPCEVYTVNSGVTASLGKTFGGVTLTIEESTVELHTDQDGETPVDEVVTGTVVKIVGNLAEITPSNYAFIMKRSVVGGTPAATKVTVIPNVGTSLNTNSEKLILKPYVGGVVTTDKNDYIVLHKAGIKAQIEMNYNMSDQRALAFEAVGYPDANSVIATLGDEDAT